MPTDGVMPKVNIKQIIHCLGRATSNLQRGNYEGLYSTFYDLQTRLADKFVEHYELIKDYNMDDFEIRWLVTETFRMGFNNGLRLDQTFPLLTATCQIVHAKNLWVYRSCPYTINIHYFGTHLSDNDLNVISLNVSAIPEIIFRSIRIR